MLEDYDFHSLLLTKVVMRNTKNQFCHLENKSSLILREKSLLMFYIIFINFIIFYKQQVSVI